jgi:hypothetical protein
VAVVSLPARGRPPQAAARRAGLEGRVRKVVTSRNDQRIDHPLLPERPPSGRLVSGRQRGHRWSVRQPPQTYRLVQGAALGPGPDRCSRRPQPCQFRPAGRTRSHTGRGWPPSSAVPWPTGPPWCPPQPATVSEGGQPDGCSGVRSPRCGPTLRSRGLRCLPADPAAAAESAPTASGRRAGVRWWGAATGARPAGAAGQAAGGAARAHRSWPAAPGPGPPRRSARRAGGR